MRYMRRPMVIGESNPHANVQALSANVPGGTGDRLHKMLKLAVRDATVSDYHEVFDRRNLCGAVWRFEDAKDEASTLMYLLQSDRAPRTVVLLGNKVRRSFSVLSEAKGINPVVWGNTTFYSIPHPSGLNRWYNDFANRKVVGVLLGLLYETYREYERA
jgi:hypothetical protein